MADILERDAAAAPRSGGPALEVELKVRGALCALELRGALNSSTVSALHAQIDQLSCTPCAEVLLDLTNLEGIDDVGVSVLVGLYHYVVGRGGQIMVDGASAPVDGALVGTPLDQTWT